MHKKNLIIPVLGIIVFYLILQASGVKTICYFKGLSGIPCPGCGYTRSFLHLFKGDIKGAFFYHPLFILPVISVVLLYLQYIKKLKIPGKIWLLFVILLFVVYGIRMLLFFPHTAPLDFERNAIFPKTIEFLYTKIHG